MDLPELEKLAATLIKSRHGDRQLAMADFRKLTINDPQACFVMADEPTRISVAEEWFRGYDRRASADAPARPKGSPRGEGAAIPGLSQTTAHPLPLPNNSPLAGRAPPHEGQAKCAGGEPSSTSVAISESPERAKPGAPSEVETLPEGEARADLSAVDRRIRAPSSEPQSPARASTSVSRADQVAVARPVRPPLVRVVAQAARARTLFESIRMHDDRPIGEIPWDELPKYSDAGFRQGWLCRAIYKRAIPADPRQTVRDLINLSDLERLQQRSAEMADAA